MDRSLFWKTKKLLLLMHQALMHAYVILDFSACQQKQQEM